MPLWVTRRWIGMSVACNARGRVRGLGRTGLVSLFINLFRSATLSCIAEWSAASRAGQQFSSRIVFWATFCWKMLIRWYQDALWEHVNAIKAVSRSQTSARPPCLLPSWPAPWDSWAPAPQPAARLIFLYFVVVLFILHFPLHFHLYILYPMYLEH